MSLTLLLTSHARPSATEMSLCGMIQPSGEIRSFSEHWKPLPGPARASFPGCPRAQPCPGCGRPTPPGRGGRPLPQVHQDAGVLPQLRRAEQVCQRGAQLLRDVLFQRQHLGGEHCCSPRPCGDSPRRLPSGCRPFAPITPSSAGAPAPQGSPTGVV